MGMMEPARCPAAPCLINRLEGNVAKEEEYTLKDVIAVGLVNAMLTAMQLTGKRGDAGAIAENGAEAMEQVVKMWNVLRKNPFPFPWPEGKDS